MVSPIRGAGQGAEPTLAHAVDAFLANHSRAGAWSAGTVVKYRQTLTGLTTGLGGSSVARSVAALDTPAGAAALDTAFHAACRCCSSRS